MDDESVGYYAVAARLSELWYFIPAIIADTFFPAIINSKNNKIEYQKRIKNLYSLMFYLALIVAIPTTIFGEWFIEILYGIEYIPAVAPLKIHVWSGIFVFIGYVFNKYLIAENYMKIAFYRTMAGAISNIILNLILIPRMGIIGAAIATLLSQAITNYIFDLFSKNLYSQFILKTKAAITLPTLPK
jgi:O-antigen/teichoic acid export membrane protein